MATPNGDSVSTDYVAQETTATKTNGKIPNGAQPSPALSWKPVYATPPGVKAPYDAREALNDIPCMGYALEQFLESHMVESEDYCHKMDPIKERMYFATGYGLIQSVKGLMSYADEDLLAAIGHTKHGNLIASQHRKKAQFLGSRLAGYVVSSLGASSGVDFIKSMTDVERHAELVYAESLFEKAMLGIVYSGDWLAFIKEALNMRATITIYRALGAFIEDADAAYAASHSSTPSSSSSSSPTSPSTPSSVPSNSNPKPHALEDPSIDRHFRSGVYLGIGMSNIILTLMPGKLATLVEMFGYKGDRKLGLKMLMRVGGWGEDEQVVDAAEEGLRRSICDMTLLIFHLVLSSFTFDGVDISIAQRILDFNLKRYPNGVFFLFGAGRMALCRSQPKRAIAYYTQAMESQSQYRNLHHISFWEIAIAHMALWDLRSSWECWRDLEREATWSKSIYSYGMAVCLLEIGTSDKEKKEAAKVLEKVPSLRQKIAGKSIPLEKFVARKARKFQAQGNRLALPVLEVAYLFHAIAHAPREVITDKMLPQIRELLSVLEKHRDAPKTYGVGPGEYYDDLCLARFLEGVCLQYVAYPDPDAVLDPMEVVRMEKTEAEKGAEKAFRAVFEYGPKIELDHHLVYHAHYELGRLLANQGKADAAKKEFELVISGKHLEVGPSGRKGRYSMENALHMRTHAALDALHHKHERL